MKKILTIITTLLIFTGCTKKTTENNTIVKQIISPQCIEIPKLYYPTQDDIWSYHDDTENLSVYWDNRYVHPNSESTCIDGILNFKSTLDLSFGTPVVDFGGPQSTIIYKLDNIYPWRDGNNLSMQVNMIKPFFNNIGGGGVYFNLFIVNEQTSERLNYVISIHTLGSAWTIEQPEVMYDPTTNTNFISSTNNKGNKFTTISKDSATTNSDGEQFYRVNITRDNLLEAVEEPEQWKLLFIGIQSELEESQGVSLMSVSYKDFQAYITDRAL